jgi:hypothetical protein
LIVVNGYLAVYNWRRRTTADKAKLASGLQLASMLVWAVLFVSRTT